MSTSARPAPDHSPSGEELAQVTADLTAVVVAVTEDDPRVLIVPADAPAARERLDGLPSGPLESGHRTLEAGLRSWVERQTDQSLGYVEQLYAFGDLDRQPRACDGGRVLSIGYLALVREARAARKAALWRGWYRYFPWEDWRTGPPAVMTGLRARLATWVAAAAQPSLRRRREERVALTFGLDDSGWNEERVLERYELLYGAGLVREALRDRDPGAPARDADLPDSRAMAADHRRILATAITRLRGKIKYRPVVFELMPPAFTLTQLQRTVEALAGLRLHTSNFRRLVENSGLVEETGATSAGTGGRPARLVRFRPEVVLERPAPGVRLPLARRSG